MSRRNLAATAAAVMLSAALLPGCRTNHDCGPIKREELAPDFALHILPGAPEPRYLTDPPTSGPHQPGPDLGGQTLSEPLSKPRQIGVLENAEVLVQYRGVDPDRLRPLLGPHVVIAPNPTLGAPIVATAWTYKRTCEAVNISDLRAFIRARAGKPPRRAVEKLPLATNGDFTLAVDTRSTRSS